MKIGFYGIVLIGLLLFQSCGPQSDASEDTAPAELDENYLQAVLAELSRDYYMGRMPFTEGEERTVTYLQQQMERMGLEPGNGNSYIQEVPMVEIDTSPDTILSINTEQGDVVLSFGEDYIFHSDLAEEEIDIQDSELVFCGYGIVDKTRGWNDFEGVDMKGKTAVVLINDPGFGSEDSTFFKGDVMTYFGRWTYKYEEANRQGADGLILIHETSSAGYPWYVIQSSWTGPMLTLPPNEDDFITDMKGWISLSKANELFKSCGLDLSAQIKASRKPGFKPVPMNASYSMQLKNKIRKQNSKNVAGILKGGVRPEEYIVYTAHWDHLGIGQAENGDSIYNGALDNASGTATIMSIAECLTRSKQKPERSIVFLFVTAEEQGLWGSAYYAENPLYPLENTVCNINKDGVNPIGEMKDFTITGLGHSEMDDIARQEAAKQDRYVIGDQQPEKGYFFRSDHFNFAKKGVPVLYGEGSYEHATKGKEYAKAFLDEYVEKNYHRPSDEYDAESWNMEGIMQDAQLYLDIGQRLANSNEWPKWNPQSEFKDQKSKINEI